MTALRALISRNVKLFFRDKGMFFTSLITPLILLVLYTTFLSDVYRDSFIMGIPEGLSLPDKLVDGCVAGQLASSLLAVSCVTVAFCANMLMVQDITTGARRDLTISPVKSSTLAAAYYAAAFISTLIVCLTALGASLIFIAAKGWYLTALDVVQLAGDVVLLTLFGTDDGDWLGVTYALVNADEITEDFSKNYFEWFNDNADEVTGFWKKGYSESAPCSNQRVLNGKASLCR